MLTTNRMLSQFDPWGMWNQINHELNSQWGDLLNAPAKSHGTPLNLWTTYDRAIVQAEVPGRGPEDIDVSIHRDLLTIDIKPLAAGDATDESLVRRERPRSNVHRHVRLPFEVDAERVEAVCEKGLLTVTLHRHESTLPSKVEVKAR
ncbi:MAG: Hsp20/alpha crystallin family protein [Planctomycetaceae bacterium]|nr:Hsp20/alpha crystallin family protein [Planctomycetaceae bacterium]